MGIADKVAVLCLAVTVGSVLWMFISDGDLHKVAERWFFIIFGILITYLMAGV
jgi:hypothetical protein